MDNSPFAAVPLPASAALACLTQQEAAQHRWFRDFVLDKAGPVSPDLPLPLAIRYAIARVEQQFLAAAASGQVTDAVPSYPLRNIFAPGVYLRELTIPAGHFVVGKLHRHAHANFLSRGKVSVLTEEGGWEILIAPCTLLSPAGTKRLLFTHEETVWTVIHPTDLTNVEAIEDVVIAKCYAHMGLSDPQLALDNLQKSEGA